MWHWIGRDKGPHPFRTQMESAVAQEMETCRSKLMLCSSVTRPTPWSAALEATKACTWEPSETQDMAVTQQRADGWDPKGTRSNLCPLLLHNEEIPWSVVPITGAANKSRRSGFQRWKGPESSRITPANAKDRNGYHLS